MSTEEFEIETFGEMINLSLLNLRAAIERNRSLISQTDNHGRTLLHHAAEVGRGDVVTYLVNAGAVVNAIDDTGRTPLHWAANYGHLPILELLLSAGAQTGVVDHGGLTPLRWAEISRSGNRQQAVATLRRFGAEPNTTDTR